MRAPLAKKESTIAKLSNRWELILGVAVAGQKIWSFLAERRREANDAKLIRVRFVEGTEECGWLVRWLCAQPQMAASAKGRRFLAKHTEARRRNEPCRISSSKGESSGEWSLIPDNMEGFVYKGVKLSVNRDDGEPKADSSKILEKAVVLSVETTDQAAVLGILEDIKTVGTDERRSLSVYTLTAWGDWREARSVPTNRTPVLPEGVLEAMLEDANWFLANQDWYQSVGIPHRRGLLLHGVPGSGKTTTAVCLAANLKKDIYVINLDGLNDEKLGSAIQSVGREGILVIEDIDCISSTNDRELELASNTKEQPTLQGLLNAIDGVGSPEGRILVATTNRIDVLDRALIRPGRIDCRHEFGHASEYQIEQLQTRFGYPTESAKLWASEELSMAAVQARLIKLCGVGNKI